jgi:hypothetical protein
MATSKRPALRKQDRVTLSAIKRPIPAYGGKPFVGRETVLTVSHLTGTGSKRNPWHVVVTDGEHFWHLEPDDVARVETSAGDTHSTMKQRGAKHDLDSWLDHHGYHHAHARKKTAPHPYAVSSRMAHARVQDGGGHKFKAGDIVRRTAARMRSMGIVSGPVNGIVVGYSGKWPRIRWSDMTDTDEPMTQAEEGLELDKRAMAKRGHARIIHQEPTGRPVFAEHERGHHITTSGRRSLSGGQFALPPGPEEKRRGIKGRLPIDTLTRARNALARAAQMKKSGHLSAGQLATVRRKVHAAWPSIESA